jgi:hypothetical protein
MNQIRKGLKTTHGSERGEADDAGGVDFGSLQTQKDAMNHLLKDYEFVSRTSPFTLEMNQTILPCTIASRILLCPLASFI